MSGFGIFVILLIAFVVWAGDATFPQEFHDFLAQPATSLKVVDIVGLCAVYLVLTLRI